MATVNWVLYDRLDLNLSQNLLPKKKKKLIPKPTKWQKKNPPKTYKMIKIHPKS